MTTVQDESNNIKSWVQSILQIEDNNFSLEILGQSDKGENYLGSIQFVKITHIVNNAVEEIDLVVKNNDKNASLHQQHFLQHIFQNEMFIYNQVFPTYRSVQENLNYVPKCLGTSIQNEVILLENLKKQGYYLWDKKKPMPRCYIDLVVTTYGKFHAIGAVIATKKPLEFQKFLQATKKLRQGIDNNFDAMFGASIQQVYELLTNSLDSHILEKWRNFKHDAQIKFRELYDFNGFQVIVHADGWANNFMFKSKNDDIKSPAIIKILDWQMSQVMPPVFDLAYFLFSCISEDDLKDFDAILDLYYESFSSEVVVLGSKADILYPKKQFLIDWYNYAKLGLLFCPMLTKMAVIDKDEAPDISSSKDGVEVGKMWMIQMKNEDAFKRRIRPVVKFAAESGII